MSVWIAVLLAGAASYLLRVVPVAWLGGRTTPAWLERTGPLVGPVAFAALAGSALAGAVGVGLVAAVPLLAAALVTGVLTRVTGAPTRSVLAGMVVLWALAALL